MRILKVALAAIILVLATGTAATARGYQAPGYESSTTQTECAGAGAFGWFGGPEDEGALWWSYGATAPGVVELPEDPTGDHAGTIVGANGTQTGINNSTLCGDPHN